MKNFFFSTLFIFIFCFSAWGQCPPGDLTFTSQQGLNNFAANYPNCTQVFGRVTIGTSDTPSNISDLSPLSQLTIISGVLEIANNPLLMDMTGLNNLFFILQITIKDNPGLLALNGFSSLTNLGILDVINNAQLSDFSGLESLSNPLARIIIDNNDGYRLYSH